MGKILDFLNMDLFKKEPKKEIKENKETPKTPDQEVITQRTVNKHKVRVSNLKDEFETLSSELAKIESDETLHSNIKTKQSDSIIKRLVLLKYEIEIREDLISWLI